MNPARSDDCTRLPAVTSRGVLLLGTTLLAGAAAAGFGWRSWHGESSATERRAERSLLTAEALDGAAYALSTAVLQLMAATSTSETAELRGTLERVRASVERALAELRFLIRLHRLGTPGPGAAGPTDPGSTAEHAAGWARRLEQAGFSVEVTAAGGSSLPETTRRTVLRTLDVAGERVLRHGQPSLCRILVEERDLDVRVEVANAARTRVSAARPGSGLRLLRHRVELSGGRLDVGPWPAPDATQVAGWAVVALVPR